MTDAALISKAQKNPNLEGVSVLIVDEAHERSLNTDIVLGIARRIRASRPRDFHVVVASATIDPKPFTDFFEGGVAVLDVPGRTFPVTLEYSPGEPLNAAVVDALETHPEGNLMVFLSGQREVDAALKKFKSAASANFVALPLYGGLPPEVSPFPLDLWMSDFVSNQGLVNCIVFLCCGRSKLESQTGIVRGTRRTSVWLSSPPMSRKRV